MKIPKPAEGDRERFTALVPEAPQVEVKPMFGNLGAFVNGNMFMGLFGSDVGIKLPEDDQQQLLAATQILQACVGRMGANGTILRQETWP
jgi:TfoX/Sxy family transcriptional regulator of competence genes